MQQVVIALGSNVGSARPRRGPREQLVAGWAEVVDALALEDAALSPIVTSAPAEGASGGPFANAVGVGQSNVASGEILARLHAIEARFGRDRRAEGVHGARTLDLDLIDCGGVIVSDAALTLPHPRFAERDFVLVPLAAVAPTWRCPIRGLDAATLAARVQRRTLLSAARPTSGLGAGALVVALCVALAACEHEPAPASAFAPLGASAPALSLHAMPAIDAAQMAALWTALASVEGEPAAADALLDLAGRLDEGALAADASARRLVIEAMVRVVQSGNLSKRFDRLRPIVDRLVRVAPVAPETRFALAYLRWIVLSDGKGGITAGRHDDSIGRELLAQLGALVRDHPDFDGPGAFDAARLAREYEALSAALSAPATPAAVAP